MPPVVILVPSLTRGDIITVCLTDGRNVTASLDAVTELGVVCLKHPSSKRSFFPYTNIIEVEF